MPKRRDDWFVKAGQVWDILAQAASRGELLTYKQVGDQIGMHHRPMGHPLGVIQSYCSTEHLPILATIVVGKISRVPGTGSVASGREDIKEIHDEVFRFDWMAHGNPFKDFVAGQTLDSFIEQVLNDPSSSADVYAVVRTRGLAQQIFRAAVSEAYQWRCAMCEMTFGNILEAAHITPWTKATRHQRISPQNGLLLCPNHHRLFDKSIITVTEEYIIRYSDPEEEDEPYSAADSHATTRLHGRKLTLPNSRTHWPDVSCITQRNLDDGWEE